MVNKRKVIDSLPESFDTEEEAGAFWDSHSTTDYLEFMEAQEDVFDIKERLFEVRISEDVFQKLRQKAANSHKSVPNVLDNILRKELTSV